jgi:nicotinamidase-related amidase
VELLQKLDIKNICIGGLALDFCVAKSAFDAKKLGFDIFVIK